MLTPKHCDECGQRGACIESKLKLGFIRRRYKCKCGHRWWTRETRTLNLTTPSKDGTVIDHASKN